MSFAGHHHTVGARNAISRGNSGDKNGYGMLGRHHTVATRRSISLTMSKLLLGNTRYLSTPRDRYGRFTAK